MSRHVIDKSYIAPQLTAREKLAAGVFVLLDVSILLFAVGISVLVRNLFSPTYPWRGKLVNALVLLGGLATIGMIAALILGWATGRYL